MTERKQITLPHVPTGVPKLDIVLGGGLPEYSFNLIVGEPGSGKTTMAHQFMFANASSERRAVYFTVLGEPTLKMLRYQQQFSFFDPQSVNDGTIRFFDLSEDALQKDLTEVLNTIIAKVEEFAPKIVVVDSFRTLVRATKETGSGLSLQEFVQQLALHLTTWQATTFLIGEYSEGEMRENPVFTMADGILWLTQNVIRNSMVRKLQVLKMRGRAPQPGLHTIRVTDDGVQVFPRMIKPIDGKPLTPPSANTTLISTGAPGVDELLGGGTFAGSALMVAGPSGSGKTTLALQFIAEGVQRGEPGVIALFEETAPKYMQQALGFGIDLQRMVKDGALELVYLRPLDLSVDETLYAIEEAVEKIAARRIVIDSVTGLEAALAPTFQEDFKESLYRLLGALTGAGITVFMTVEVSDPYDEMRFTPHAVSFLTHDIILQRYVEIDGQLATVLAVIKTQGREHSRDLRAYTITSEGIVVGERLTQYRGILTAVPELKDRDR